MRDLGLIKDGAVLIVNGRIEDVGPSRRVENLAGARQAIEISADGRVVMPGFVDCRTHLVSGPPLLDEYVRRIEDGTQSDGGERALRSAIRSATRPHLELLARRTLREFIRHGTTTLDGHSGPGLDEKTELKILRALSGAQDGPLDLLVTFSGAAGLPEDYRGGAAAYLDGVATSLLPKIRKHELADFVDIRIGSGGFTAGQSRRYLSLAQSHGFIPRITTSENEPSNGVALAMEMNVPCVDHLEFITGEEVRQLARSNTIAALVPGASYHRLREGYAPAARLINEGAAVAVASGYSSDRCPSCSMPAILSLACNQMRMTPAEAITAATINGAHALCCGGRIGSIEHGKDADLIMLNVSDYREIPYHFGMSLVAMTMKRGDVIYPRMEFSWAKE